MARVPVEAQEEPSAARAPATVLPPASVAVTLASLPPATLIWMPLEGSAPLVPSAGFAVSTMGGGAGDDDEVAPPGDSPPAADPAEEVVCPLPTGVVPVLVPDDPPPQAAASNATAVAA